MRFSLNLASMIGSVFLVSATSYAFDENVFNDVPSTHPDADAIRYFKNSGVIEGYESGDFLPNHSINRAEFTKLVIKSVFSDEEIDELLSRVRLKPVEDVPYDAWFGKYVYFAYAKEIVSGNPDGLFHPEETINFATAAKILANVYGLPVTHDDKTWWRGYVDALQKETALPANYEAPDQPVERVEMTHMLYVVKTSGNQDGGGCMRTGCSGQLCADVNVTNEFISTCEWRQEYACYAKARCERQESGACGWTITPELAECLVTNDSNPETDSSCAAVTCLEGTVCKHGVCVEPSSSESSSAEFSSSSTGSEQASSANFSLTRIRSSSSGIDRCPMMLCPDGTVCKNSQCIPISSKGAN